MQRVRETRRDKKHRELKTIVRNGKRYTYALNYVAIGSQCICVLTVECHLRASTFAQMKSLYTVSF